MPSVYIPAEFSDGERLMAAYLMGYGDGLWGGDNRAPALCRGHLNGENIAHAYDVGFAKGQSVRELNT